MLSKLVKLSAFFVSLCLSTARAQDLPIITVGFLAPLSGPLKSMGEETRNAAALNLVRSRLEFKKLGFDLRFKSYDDKGSVEEGIRLAQDIVKNDDVLAVIGPILSNVALPVTDLLSKANVGVITAAGLSYVTDRGLGNVNRIIASDTTSAEAAVDYLRGTGGVKTVYVLDDGNRYGKGLAALMVQKLGTDGVQVVGSSSVQSLESIQNAVTALKTLKPDVLYYAGEYDTAVPVLKTLRSSGLDTLFFGSETLNFSAFFRAAGKDARGILYTSAVAPAAGYPAAGKFGSDYLRLYKQPITGVGIMSHDALETVLAALKDALAQNNGKLPSRVQVSSALRAVRVQDAFSGEVSFNTRGERRQSTVFVLRFENDGSFRVVDTLHKERK